MIMRRTLGRLAAAAAVGGAAAQYSFAAAEGSSEYNVHNSAFLQRRDDSAMRAFYSSSVPPKDLSLVDETAKRFVETNVAAGRRIAIVTSGGTLVPLEKRMVRFIDNFSTGTRGAACAERLMDEGYAVLFLHRSGSKRPYMHVLQDVVEGMILSAVDAAGGPGSADHDAGRLGDTATSTRVEHQQWSGVDKHASPSLWGIDLSVLENWRDAFSSVDRLSRAVDGVATAKASGRLLEVPFTSVQDYLFKLRTVATNAAEAKEQSMILLAAAVSDFYIPETEMSEHKIQSDDVMTPSMNSRGRPSLSSGAPAAQTAAQDVSLTLHLRPVPKTLHALKGSWAPSCCVVSFKLETDPPLLLRKAGGAIQAYGVDAVVANILERRYSEVTLVRGMGSGDDATPTRALQGGRSVRVGSNNCALIDSVEHVTTAAGPILLATTIIAAPTEPSRLPGDAAHAGTATLKAPRAAASSAAGYSLLPSLSLPVEDALVTELVALHDRHIQRAKANRS